MIGYSAADIAAAAPHLLPSTAPPPVGVILVPAPSGPPAPPAAVLAAATSLLDATGAGFGLVYGVTLPGDAVDGRIIPIAAAQPSESIGKDLFLRARLLSATVRRCLPTAAEFSVPGDAAASIVAWRGKPPIAGAFARGPAAGRASYAPRLALRATTPHARDCALLIIDTQNYSCRPSSPLWAGRETTAEGGYFFGRLDTEVEKNWVALVAAARACIHGCGPNGAIPIIYTVMASKQDGGSDDVCQDYRTSGFIVPARSWDAQVIASLPPRRSDIILAKGSCNAFASSPLDHALRSLGVRHCVVVGVVADQCVSAACATAADLNYGVTFVTDGVAALSEGREQAARVAMAGFCRMVSTAQVVGEWS